MSFWFEQMSEIADRKYQDQINYLRENYGFTQVHANALVLYSRGSTTSRRYKTFDQYLTTLDNTQSATITKIFDVLTKKYPSMELVIAWNQPMLKYKGNYVFGASAARNHITIAPFNAKLIDEFRPRLAGYVVNKKTIRVPSDWDVDAKLLRDIMSAQLKSA